MIVILFNGILLIILALISLFFATKLKPNYLVGYRSMRANSDQQSYLEANRFAGRFMLVEGIISVLISYPLGLAIPRSSLVWAGLLYFVLSVSIMYIVTEIHLKNKFGS